MVFEVSEELFEIRFRSIAEALSELGNVCAHHLDLMVWVSWEGKRTHHGG